MMAKNRVLFNKRDGKVVGVLEKFELEIFDAQRGLENFHVVKMNEEELNDSFEYLDMGMYIPIYYDDLIVFPHEELSYLEIADGGMSFYVNTELPKAINRFMTTLRLEDDEKSMLQIALGTTLNILGQVVDMEVNHEEALHYRNYLLKTMKEFDVKEDYK